MEMFKSIQKERFVIFALRKRGPFQLSTSTSLAVNEYQFGKPTPTKPVHYDYTAIIPVV